jgi:uncharacterized Zn finger protein
VKTRREIAGRPRDCWRTRNVSASCDVCGARPEVVHIPTRGRGFRCSEHCENCGPAVSRPEGELPRK